MKDTIPFLVYMNAIIILLPGTCISAMMIGSQYGILAGALTGFVGLNLSVLAMKWGLDRA